MGWRDWSYAKKGAVVGIILGAISLISVIIGAGALNCSIIDLSGSGSSDPSICNILVLGVPYVAILLAIAIIFSQLGIGLPETVLFGSSALILLVILFLLGALLGYIIGKIKSRKQTQTPIPSKK